MKSLALVLSLVTGAGLPETPAVPAAAIAVHAGQPAPSDGVFLTTMRAATISDAQARCVYERDALRAELEQRPASGGGGVLLAGLLGIVLGAGLAWALRR